MLKGMSAETFTGIIAGHCGPFTIHAYDNMTAGQRDTQVIFEVKTVIPDWGKEGQISHAHSRPTEIIEHCLMTFANAVRDSLPYKNDIAAKEKEISGLLDQLQKAHEKIEKLTPYKQHFDLEKELRHNNKGDDSAN